MSSLRPKRTQTAAMRKNIATDNVKILVVTALLSGSHNANKVLVTILLMDLMRL